jgi:hypothetical protein
MAVIRSSTASRLMVGFVAEGERVFERVAGGGSFFAGLLAKFELDRAVVEVFQEKNSLQQIL